MVRFHSPFATILERQKTLPVDVDGIARDLGLKVRRVLLDDGAAGRITPVEPGNIAGGFAIDVNAAHGATRQRFTLAHEIAHYILHRDLVGAGVTDNLRYASRELDQSFETQANRMAVDILMPAASIQSFMARGVTDPAALAELFGVTAAAMAVRVGGLERRATAAAA